MSRVSTGAGGGEGAEKSSSRAEVGMEKKATGCPCSCTMARFHRYRGFLTMRILEEALTFDDVLLVPAHSDFLPRDADLSTQLTRSIRLNLPILSAARDPVTEARLAITIAQEGGLGIVHKNMSIEAQAREVQRVKKFESGMIHEPRTTTP